MSFLLFEMHVQFSEQVLHETGLEMVTHILLVAVGASVVPI